MPAGMATNRGPSAVWMRSFVLPGEAPSGTLTSIVVAEPTVGGRGGAGGAGGGGWGEEGAGFSLMVVGHATY